MNNCMFKVVVGGSDKQFAECVNCGRSVRLGIGGEYANNLAKALEKAPTVKDNPKKFIGKWYDKDFDYSCRAIKVGTNRSGE